MDIYEKIRTLRTDRGISQEELAEKIGYSRSMVSRLENGLIDDLPLSRAVRIAEVLGVTVSELLGESNALPLRQRRLIAKFEALNKEQREFVQFVIDREFSNLEAKK